jgi:hypothetical protein
MIGYIVTIVMGGWEGITKVRWQTTVVGIIVIANNRDGRLLCDTPETKC